MLDYGVVKKNYSSAETGFPNKLGSVVSGVSTEKILENAEGYKRLGLLDEARSLCETVSDDEPLWEYAQFLLIGLDLCQERMIDAANRATAFLARREGGSPMILFAAMAMHQSGNPQKAYNLLMAHQGLFTHEVDAAYSFACYGGSAGEVDVAIEALLFNYRNSKHYWSKSCLDADLEPIWVRSAAGNVSLESSLALAHPVMLQALETSMAYQKEIPIDYVIKSQVPENCRDYLRVQPVNGFYTLDRETPSDIRDRYLDWQQEYKARTMKLAQKAIQFAKEVVLDHQLEWAMEKAKAGNLVGARYHVLFALGNRPLELQRFAQELRPLGLEYFFDELLYAVAFDPAICVKLRQVTLAQEAGLTAVASDLLDEIPTHLQPLIICLLPRANNENRRGYHHFATQLYKQIARRWPTDPVGYYNAIENLMEDEKWEEASKVFDQAPESYRILVLSQQHRTQLDNHEYKSNKGDVFYGQPEWDERLEIIPVVKKELFKFGKK